MYGTCDKEDPAACSLSSTQGCGIGTGRPGFGESLLRGDVVGAVRNEASDVGDTIAAVPGAFRTWDAADYVVPQASYQGGYRQGLPTALEVIDPGCQFCGQLFRNARQAGLAQTHNVTYIVYPIGLDLAPRFQNSPLVARYLTAVRLTEADARIYAGDYGYAGDVTDHSALLTHLEDTMSKIDELKKLIIDRTTLCGKLVRLQC